MKQVHQKKTIATVVAAMCFGLSTSWALAADTAKKPEPKFTIQQYQLEGNTLLSTELANQLLAKFTGENKEFADIQEAVEALKSEYQALGYPVVSIFPPKQTMTTGVVKLQVIEGKIKNISVKGNKAYDEANILASLPPLQLNAAPNVNAVVAAVAVANENPAKQVQVNFEGGKVAGDVSAHVNVTEDQIKKAFVSLDNTGLPTTGLNRIAFGWQHANLFNLDHMLVAQVGTSLDKPEKGYNVSLGYRIPLYPQGLSVDLIAAYSKTNTGDTAVPGGTMAYTGEGSSFGVRLNQPLANQGNYRHKLVYGVDYRDFNNRCSGNATPTCGTVTTQPLSLSYQGQYTVPQNYLLSGSATLVGNLPGGAHGGADAYALARSNADRHWTAYKANLSFLKQLPEDWQLKVNVSGQYSPDRLVSAEQFGVGGMNTVRGYSERALLGDSGHAASLEVYTPELSRALALSGMNLRLLAFVDTGRIEYTRPNSLEHGQTLSSVGLGARLNWMKDLNLRFDLGWVQQPLVSAAQGISRDRGAARGTFVLNYSF